jgi:uncharacterized protein (DUF362 family)
MDRREFLIRSALAAAGATFVGTLIGCARGAAPAPPAATGAAPGAKPIAAAGGPPGKVGSNRYNPTLAGDVTLALAQNGSPGDLTRTAINRYGGLSTWVKPGDRVVIKPNLAYGSQPAQAADVHPEVLAAILALCKEAQAQEIIVVEHPLAAAQMAFEQSGAQAVCHAAGARLVNLGSQSLYQKVAFPAGVGIKDEEIARDLLECDAYINVAVAKVHNATGVTLGMKNQMGAIFNRPRYHASGSASDGADNLSLNIADLAVALRPTLTFIDATRALMSNGPGGPGLVEQPHTVLVSADQVAADAYACRFLKVDPKSVAHLRVAADRGLGKLDPATFKVAAA